MTLEEINAVSDRLTRIETKLDNLQGTTLILAGLIIVAVFVYRLWN
jgi:hypothetical protein